MAISGGWGASLAAIVGGIALGAAGMAGWYSWRGPDKAATEAIVRDYVLNHGEILPEAMKRMQDRQAAASVTRHRSALETPYHAAWAGAANGDVVLVEFFDYACPYCRETNADVERLLSEDPRLKVVWRELPVLGPNSEAAANASLAAARQGRFRQFHERLFALGRPTEATLAQAMAEAGVSAEADPPEARAELARNVELARAMEATGTPTFIVGNQVLQGAVGYDALKAAIAEVRRSRS
ncbi:MAG TPA: DsbA family protein [Allosphingosinicella sp.]|nr:DsbA family protein [Allosphingosinicella sp.]